MKNLFSVIILVLTAAAVSASLVFWYLSLYPAKSRETESVVGRSGANSQSKSSATQTIVNPSDQFQPGLKTLTDLYENQPEMVSDPSFSVNLSGIVKSVSSENLIIRSNTNEFFLPLNDKESRVSFYQGGNEGLPPKAIDKSAIKQSDMVKIKLNLNPLTGNIMFSFVTKTN